MTRPDIRIPSAFRSPLSTAWLIHLFALAHAVVAIAGRLLNYYDDVPLTLLTISMIVLISVRHRLPLQASATITLIASFFGFLAGIYGARGLRLLFDDELIPPALTTFLITEMVGWGTWRTARNLHDQSRPATATGWIPTSVQIVLIAAGILLLRVCYVIALRDLFPGAEGFYPTLRRIVSHGLAMLLLLCGNLLIIHLLHRYRRRFRPVWIRPLLGALMLILLSAAAAAVVFYTPVPGSAPRPTDGFLQVGIIAGMVCIVSFALLALVYFLYVSSRELNRERLERHLAQYRYSRFKQQINPHFLFNSLNNLDALIQAGDKEGASAFTRKLAGLYRQLLRYDGELLVTLRDEMRFAGMYIELIQVRFADGLCISTDLPDERLDRLVVPCSVQQLIENAVKHNSVTPEAPLRIAIRSDESGWISVENNLQPRLSRRIDSTRLGLNNLSQQYLDLAGRDIRIIRTEASFRVELPLIQPDLS